MTRLTAIDWVVIASYFLLLAAVGDFNFLYFSGVLFLVSVVTIMLASRSGRPPDPDRIRVLTFDSIDRAAVRASWNAWDVAATIIVLGLVLAVYSYFSFWTN